MKLKPSNIEWPRDFSLEKIGMSQSMWDKWLSCPRAFILHINGYSQPMKEIKTHFGSVCHEINDKVYSAGERPSIKQINEIIDDYSQTRILAKTALTQYELEFEAAKALAVMIEYFEYYKEDFKTKKFIGVERVFNQVYNGCMQRGKIDGSYRSGGKKWLMEHKTKGRINEYNLLTRLPLDFQNLFYLLNDEIETGELATGVLYNVIRNPSTKLHKNESFKDYYERIKEACRKDPDHYFKRWESPYSETDHDLFREELEQHIQSLKDKTFLPVPSNRFNCEKGYACSFLEACSTDSLDTLTKSDKTLTEYIFPELQDEKDNLRKITCKKSFNKINSKIKEKSYGSKKSNSKKRIAVRKKIKKKLAVRKKK